MWPHHHNCVIHNHAGVILEYGSYQESNNTLITVNDARTYEAALLCSTDKTDCCTDIDTIAETGNWFLPNGSKVLIPSKTNIQSLSITLGNQTLGLNITNSSELPTGIYHCEMVDKENVTHHLYAGIYPEDEGRPLLLLCQFN